MSIRALKIDSDWAQALDIQVACSGPEFEEAGYREYRQKQMDRYRKMAASGLGDWFGAFVDQQLVADLGLFHDQGVGRFQSVETHPDFRRRGIAGTLIHGAGRQAKAEYDLHTLVIVAEQASSPARLYESLGFQPRERQLGLEWWPQIDSHTSDYE